MPRITQVRLVQMVSRCGEVLDRTRSTGPGGRSAAAADRRGRARASWPASLSRSRPCRAGLRTRRRRDRRDSCAATGPMLVALALDVGLVRQLRDGRRHRRERWLSGRPSRQRGELPAAALGSADAVATRPASRAAVPSLTSSPPRPAQLPSQGL